MISGMLYTTTSSLKIPSRTNDKVCISTNLNTKLFSDPRIENLLNVYSWLTSQNKTSKIGNSNFYCVHKSASFIIKLNVLFDALL